MDRRRRFWLGLVILLLAPLLVLAAFALYVYIANSRPQSGDLQTKVSPQVVMPWSEAVYYMDFAGFKPTPTPVPVPTATPTPTPVPLPSLIDMVFIVDESSSMTSSIGDMANAAQSVVQDLANERRGRIRYAAIRFDEAAETQTDWTDKPEKLIEGLNAIAQAPNGRGTNGFVAFEKLKEVLATARPNADKVAIFYTDGEMYCPLICADQLIEEARQLREGQSVDFYSVGLPYKGSDPIMTEITADPYRVFDPLNPAELARVFQEIKSSVSQQSTPGSPASPATRTPRDSSGQLSHQVDGRHFATPLRGTNWMLSSGALNLLVRPVPEVAATYAHPLVPLSAGLWRVGVEPPRFVFFDKAGQRHEVSAPRRPLLLKVTYFTLFLMALPGLLWTAAHLLPRRRTRVIETKEWEAPDITPPTLPEPLPLLPRLTVQRLSPVPTLFVGLGGAGRRALHAIRADLKQAHLGADGQPYSFLWIDTDTQEENRPLPFEDWPSYKIQSMVAPPGVSQLDGRLPVHGQVDEHLQWFNPYSYREASRAKLNLADGAKGERPLARFALFRWLSETNGILPTLVEHVRRLAEFQANDGMRQIVIVGSTDGGAGGGWFLDFGRLFQRISREHEGLEALPDVIGILNHDPKHRHPENERALSLEIDTAQAARKFPQRVTFSVDDKLLDQIDFQSPYHWIFSVNAGDENSVAAQCGELVSLMVERQPRARLLDNAQKVSASTVVAADGYSAHVLPTLIFDQVKCELFLRILGPDILLDVVPDVQGGLKPQPVTSDRALDLLNDWSQLEISGTPLQLLLAAARDPLALNAFVSSMRAPSSERRDWFSKAFATSLTQRLQGHSVGDGGWVRDCKPAEAIAMLRLLSSQLEQKTKPELTKQNAPADAMDIVNHVISLADTAANDLERWLLDFCHECEKVAAKRDQLEQARKNLLRLEGRLYLDLDLDPGQVQRWAQDGLQAWLGTPDTISAIRKRLFFAITDEGTDAHVSVMSYIAEDSQRYTTAGEVAAAIDQLANSLALHVPTVRISGVLASMPGERRRDLARGLVPTENRPEEVLLVLPQLAGLGDKEQQALEEFESGIPKPPTHGPRTTQHGDDHSAVRRIELQAAVTEQGDSSGSLTFVEMTGSMAEAVRRRAESKYQIALPLFPPRLRIALAHPRAFRSFSRAYKAGHITLRRDASGRQQWSIGDHFLTFENESSLAHAAANYVRDVNNHQESFADKNEKGSFANLEKWRNERAAPDSDTLTQIAIDVYED
jgi:hypothetical protein